MNGLIVSTYANQAMYRQTTEPGLAITIAQIADVNRPSLCFVHWAQVNWYRISIWWWAVFFLGSNDLLILVIVCVWHSPSTWNDLCHHIHTHTDRLTRLQHAYKITHKSFDRTEPRGKGMNELVGQNKNETTEMAINGCCVCVCGSLEIPLPHNERQLIMNISHTDRTQICKQCLSTRYVCVM